MKDNNTRYRILEAALDLADVEGVAALTQPRIAKAAGLRQSHLTYYFPRKADLFIALLEASHERADADAELAAMPLAARLARLMLDRERMRFFLSIVLEINEDPVLQGALRDHTDRLAAKVAAHVARDAHDPDVRRFLDALRGFGTRCLFAPIADGAGPGVVQDLARRHGIALPSD